MVLVVDDQPDIRDAMVRLLQFDGYEAEAVGSGDEALQFLHTRLPHCMILDISMPDMDGFDVLMRIRATPACNGLRVIMYSAFDGELKDRAMRLGADAFVQKGTLDWSQIQRVLSEHCGQGRSTPERTQVSPRPDAKDVG